MINTGKALLEHAEFNGIEMRVEDEPWTRSSEQAWRDALEYAGSANVRFRVPTTHESMSWALLVTVNAPEEVLSDYGVTAWIDNWYNDIEKELE
jgi:hypothetical protein